jgi:RNA polymerase sigma factor (sigma-70 family)
MNEQGRPQVLPDKSDVALVERYLEKRSEESFRALYRAKAGRMLMLAQRLCGGSGHEAEDIVQEAWIRACAALPRFAWRSSLTTWLCGIVVNCVREARRAPEHEELEEQEVAARMRGETLDLEALVRRLPQRCREVIVLHDIEGYTHEEIGTLLGVAEGTSRHHLFRARQMLTEWMGQPAQMEKGR